VNIYYHIAVFSRGFALLHNPKEKNTKSAGQDGCCFRMRERQTKEEEKKDVKDNTR